MKKYLLAIGLFATSVCFADPPPNYPFNEFDEGLRLARQQSKPIFLYFGRLGCAWCDKTNKESFSNEELRKLYTNHFVLVYVDAESGKRIRLPSGERITEAELGARFKAFATPLFVFLQSDGKEIVKIPGYKTVEDFKDYDRFVTEGHYKKETLLQFLSRKKT